MSQSLTGTVAIITGASSGIGHATALKLASLGASVAVVARRRERLDALCAEIDSVGGAAFAVAADITSRSQAEAAVQAVIDRFGRVDILVNNAGLMLLGPVVDSDPAEWEQMIAINQSALLYMTHAALPHLLSAAETGERQVADIVNISSRAARSAAANFAVYSMTKFGVNGFTEALRQEVTKKRVRVGVLEPGAVVTELVTHNTGAMRADLDAFSARTEKLEAEDIADGVAYMVTRGRRTSISQIWIMPTDQA